MTITKQNSPPAVKPKDLSIPKKKEFDISVALKSLLSNT